jgi:hypothetical protein
MSEEQRDGTDAGNGERDGGQPTTKRMWAAPTIDEVDYTQTEAAYGVPGVADAGIYTN